MGGILHLFEFNQAGTSRKLLTQKRHTDGLEAPRNSLELPIETSSHEVMHDNVPYSYQVKQHSSKVNFAQSGTSMKKLIDDEISKPMDTRRNAPSVVARLMGMDMLPTEAKPMIHAKERGNESAWNNNPRVQQADSASTQSNPFNSKPVRQTKHDLFPQNSRLDSDQLSNRLKLARPQPREHPQEEQLQKFKKEFEAWQASKVWECSRIIELGDNPRPWKDNQVLAQENLSREKMARYDDRRTAGCKKPFEIMEHASPSTFSMGMNQMGGLQHFHPNRKEAMTLRSKARPHVDLEQFPQMSSEEKYTRTLPTKIVILKPGLERSSYTEESWPGSSEIVEEEGSIEDFLEEVKERLRSEIQGNVRKDAKVRGSGNDTPVAERPTDPKEIARHIAKHVRENVTRDLGMSLQRSESTRSYRSEVQFNGPDSPEFINRDTRKFLSERLRNVLRNEIDLDIPAIISGSSRSNDLGDEMGPLKPMKDISRTGKKVAQCETMKYVPGTKTRSFRHEQLNDALFDTGETSPRNLIRSLSAPVSGTSFGKLLLEEPRVLTGAHIRRKHEATEIVSMEVRKSRKERFNLRGKVSNLRHSFTLRGKLFGKKVQSVEESRPKKSYPMNFFMTTPSVLMNFGIAQENSTEVPPSPASVCSSAHDDFSRPGDHPSPVSTLDSPFIEENHVPQVFKEISSNLHELRRQLNQLQHDGSQEPAVEEESLEPELVNVESQAHAYVRDILIAAGFYDGYSPLTYPIGSWVFEQVEAAYRKSGKESQGAINDSSESKVTHKLLFDLLNEAMSTIARPTVTRPRLIRWVYAPTPAVPRRKKLLDDVWEMIQVYMYPSMDGCHSLDGIVVRDLQKTRWTAMVSDEIDVIAREIESVILVGLIEETMRDICC